MNLVCVIVLVCGEALILTSILLKVSNVPDVCCKWPWERANEKDQTGAQSDVKLMACSCVCVCVWHRRAICLSDVEMEGVCLRDCSRLVGVVLCCLVKKTQPLSTGQFLRTEPDETGYEANQAGSGRTIFQGDGRVRTIRPGTGHTGGQPYTRITLGTRPHSSSSRLGYQGQVDRRPGDTYCRNDP